MLWEENQYLIHYGIKGQKRGIRRYQNEDGTLTAEGKERYGNMKDRGDSGFKKWSPFTNEGGNYAYAKWRSRRHNKNLSKWEGRKSEKEAAGKSSARVDRKIAKYQSKKEAQGAANANLDAYRRHSSGAKLFVQNAMGTPVIANAYRHARARGTGRLGSMLEAGTPIGGLLRMHRDKKKYGKYIVYGDNSGHEYNAMAMDRD